MKCIRARIGIRSGKEPTDKMHKEEGKRQSERAMSFPHLMLFFSILRAARADADRRRRGRGRVTGDTRGTITGEEEIEMAAKRDGEWGSSPSALWNRLLSLPVLPKPDPTPLTLS